MAALTTEIPRHSRSTRAAFDGVVRSHAADFARFMPAGTAAERERAALVLFAGMAGVLNLARAASDESLRRAILEQARALFVRALRPGP